MAGLYNAKHNKEQNKIGIKKGIAYFICFGILIVISVFIQTTIFSVFETVPMLTFAISCAIGFLCGEKVGAVAGLFSGAVIDILGNTGVWFSPLLYMFCGYICGALVGWFLSENLPSFLVYATVAGAIKEIYTVILYGLFSESFRLFEIIMKLVIPEFLTYLLCILPAYGAVFVIHTLIKGKNKKQNYQFKS